MVNIETFLGVLNLAANGGCAAMLFYIILVLIRKRRDY